MKMRVVLCSLTLLAALPAMSPCRIVEDAHPAPSSLCLPQRTRMRGMGSHSPLRQQHRAWLRGGGEGKQEARIPEDALGVMSSKGLQLRPVRWPDEGPSLAPETNTTEVSALRRPGAEDTGEDSNSFSSEATSEDYQAAEPGLTEIKPAQAELWAASRDGDGAAIDRLVKACGADIDAHDPEFGLWTACHYAACAGRLRIMQTLWRLGADIDACNGAGSAPLCLAASEGHLSLVQKLVSWGADINATNLQGSSALHGAAFNGCTRTCEKLLALGADVHCSNCLGVTPLHMAVAGTHVDTVEMLLGWGAKLDQANLDGWTALHYAAQTGHEAMVDMLLTRGARPDAKSNLDETPLEQALRHANVGVGMGEHAGCFRKLWKSVFETTREDDLCDTNVASRPRSERQEEFDKRERQRWINRDILAGQQPRVAPLSRRVAGGQASSPACISEVRSEGCVLWDSDVGAGPRPADNRAHIIPGGEWDYQGESKGSDDHCSAGSMSEDHDAMPQQVQADAGMMHAAGQGEEARELEELEQEDRLLRLARERDLRVMAACNAMGWEDREGTAVASETGLGRAGPPRDEGGQLFREVGEFGQGNGEEGGESAGDAGERLAFGERRGAEGTTPETGWPGNEHMLAAGGPQGIFLSKLAQVERLAAGDDELMESEDEPGYKEQARWSKVAAGFDECLASLPRNLRMSLEDVRRKMPEQVALWALRKEREAKDAGLTSSGSSLPWTLAEERGAVQDQRHL